MSTQSITDDVPMTDVTVEDITFDDGTLGGTTDGAHVDNGALFAALERDVQSLTKRGTLLGYVPFEIEYRECLEKVFGGEPPNVDNAFQFLLFHAYRPARTTRKAALSSGRFSIDEWNLVTNNAQYAQGIAAELHKDQFVISRGHLTKVRSAILKVAERDAPEVHFMLQNEPRMKSLLSLAVQRKKRNKRLNFMEKGSTRVHSLEAWELRQAVEGHFWDVMSNQSKRAMCSMLRHRATLNTTLTTLFRNDSWVAGELSDMAFYQWKDHDEVHPFQCLNFELDTKTTRDSEKAANGACLRHKDPRYCPQGSIAFYLYLRFMITDEPLSWDMLDNSSWFSTKINVSIGDKKGCARYDQIPSNNTYYTKLKESATHLGFDFKHWEHFGRHYGAAILELMRVQKEARASHGGWEKKVYDNHYSTGLEITALLGAAGFKPDVRGSYRSARTTINPPEELVEKVWPWIEEHRQKLKESPEGHKRVTAHRFLKTMSHLRIVLLQDAAWLMQRGRGDHGFFHIAGSIFCTREFQDWSEKYNQELTCLEDPKNDPNFQLLERANSAIAGTLMGIHGHQESASRRLEKLEKLTAASAGVDLATSLKIDQLLRFQQYMALHQSQTAAFASSIPPFDPNQNYNWPSVRVHHQPIHTTVNAIIPPPREEQPPCPGVATDGGIITGQAHPPTINELGNVGDADGESPPKNFDHFHDGTLAVMNDFYGREGSIFNGYGGFSELRKNETWYRNLRSDPKDNETAKSYVRRLCRAGEGIDHLIKQDMEQNSGKTFDESLEDICKKVDSLAQNLSKNKRYVSLKK